MVLMRIIVYMRISVQAYLAHISKAGLLMQGIRIDSKPLD